MTTPWKVTPAGQNQIHTREGDGRFPWLLQGHQEGKGGSVHFGFPSADMKLRAKARVISAQDKPQKVNQADLIHAD